jgi:DNA (cytosine-5)-methyltransferase 1
MTKGINTTCDEGQTPIVAFHPTQDPISSVDGSTHAMGCGSKGGCCTQAVAIDLQNVQVGGDLAGTLDTTRPSRGGGQAVAQGFAYSGYSNQPAWMTGDRTDCLPASGHSDGSHQGVGVVCGDGETIGTLRSNHRNNSDPKTEAAMHIMHGMAVRRLTPKECERLQGFPDGYTDVTYRGKPAADGPRYRALGNSMAVPVMAWIGNRIQMVKESMDGR